MPEFFFFLIDNHLELILPSSTLVVIPKVELRACVSSQSTPVRPDCPLLILTKPRG